MLARSISLLSALALTSYALPQYGGQSEVTSSEGLAWFAPETTTETSTNGIEPVTDGTTDLTVDFVQKSAVVDDTTQTTDTTGNVIYECFHGDPANYPSVEEWLPFETLWSINEPTISSSNDGDTTIVGYIKDAIGTVSAESKMDPRLTLAAMMQESRGQASVECTHSGEVHNCGLLQGPYESVSFDSSNPESSIERMIRDGVQGTTSGGPTGAGGPGYVQYLNPDLSWVTNPYPGNPYAAARGYNSGSIGENLDVPPSGTASYANDVANRLIGWVGGEEEFAACGAQATETETEEVEPSPTQVSTTAVQTEAAIPTEWYRGAEA